MSGGNNVLQNTDVDFIIEFLINSKNNFDIFNKFKSYGFDLYLITHGALVKEDRPLTLANPDGGTLWMNHFATKRPVGEVEELSKAIYGRFT